jgi:tRNA (Thr-GGU) A37 N-methylase
VVRVDGTVIEFIGVDVLDGTPVLDLKLQKD